MADLRLKTEGQSKQIFDSVRKKFVALTPEEWVRQHFIHFMINIKKYPASLMGVEMLVKVNNLSQRSDIVVFQSNGNPWLIVECKAPHITINQDTFYQAARYNSSLKVPFIVITNGLEHYCLHFNGKDFQLVPKHTACLASDACGIPQTKQNVQLKELQTANQSCCTPGSGCC